MEERNMRATLEGVVISSNNDKTITVLVETYKRHKIYGKRVKYRKKYYAHDENNEAEVGDFVRIMATRPISKTKRWRLVEVLTLAEVSIEEYQEALAEQEVLEEIDEARYETQEHFKLEQEEMKKAKEAELEAEQEVLAESKAEALEEKETEEAND